MRDVLEKLAADLSNIADALEKESGESKESTSTTKEASEIDFSMGSVGNSHAAGASDPLLDWIMCD